MTSIYLLVGHLTVAADGLAHSAELVQTLAKAGWDKASAHTAQDLADQGLSILEAMTEDLDNRIAEHSVHAACAELEMWLQTVRFSLREVADDDQMVTWTGSGIHVHDHTATTVAQVLRALGSLRGNPKVIASYATERKCSDVAGRGWTLLKRLLRSTEIFLEGADQSAVPPFEAQANAWFEPVDAAAATFVEKAVCLLPNLGYFPEGLGRPLGGAGFSVVRHQRGQGVVPEPDTYPSTGWSCGRQGRNRHNSGNGRVEPTFG